MEGSEGERREGGGREVERGEGRNGGREGERQGGKG